MDVKDNIEEMAKRTQEFSTSLYKVNKRLHLTPEYTQLKEQINICQNTIETFEILNSPSYEDIH